MKQWIHSGVVLWSCLLLVGCVSSGNPSIANQSLLDQIKLDLSTKEDVKRILGPPDGMSRSSTSSSQFPGLPPAATLTNVEAWSYTHIDVEVDGATFIPIVGLFAGGATSTVNIYTVMFDDIRGRSPHYPFTITRPIRDGERRLEGSVCEVSGKTTGLGWLRLKKGGDMARRKKGAVRRGRGTMCNICGLNCGRGGPLKRHVEGGHGVEYE